MRNFILLVFVAMSGILVAQEKPISIIVTNGVDDALVLDSTLFEVIASRNDSSIIYRVNYYKGLSHQSYVSINISEKDLVVFQWIEEVHNKISSLQAIDQRRTEWMKLCNQHDAENLVNQLYTEDAIYFNHKPLIQGRSEIIKDYQYMNNPDYALKLSPLYVKAISDRIVFEIGQCSGSYPGKYILVWEKADSGEWFVKMDSNI